MWTRYIQEICGVSLDTSKAYLLETRFGGMLKDTNSANFSELFRKVRADSSNALRRKIIDSIVTNETSFFRDTSPYELLQHKILPDLIDRRSRSSIRPIPIRIWSAACSTGQEVYSIAMVLKELLGDRPGYDAPHSGNRHFRQGDCAGELRSIHNSLELSRGVPPDKLTKSFCQNSAHKQRFAMMFVAMPHSGR